MATDLKPKVEGAVVAATSVMDIWRSKLETIDSNLNSFKFTNAEESIESLVSHQSQLVACLKALCDHVEISSKPKHDDEDHEVNPLDLSHAKVCGKYANAYLVTVMAKNKLSPLASPDKGYFRVGAMKFDCVLRAIHFMQATFNNDAETAIAVLLTVKHKIKSPKYTDSLVLSPAWERVRKEVMRSLIWYRLRNSGDQFRTILLKAAAAAQFILMDTDEYWGSACSKHQLLVEQADFIGKNVYGELLQEAASMLKDEKEFTKQELFDCEKYCCGNIEVDDDTQFIILGDQQLQDYVPAGNTKIFCRTGATYYANPSDLSNTLHELVETNAKNMTNVSHLVIAAGTNEIGTSMSSMTTDGFYKLVRYCMLKFPSAKICCMAVPPRMDSTENTAAVEALNVKLRQVCSTMTPPIQWIGVESVEKDLPQMKLRTFAHDGVYLYAFAQRKVIEALMMQMPFLEISLKENLEKLQNDHAAYVNAQLKKANKEDRVPFNPSARGGIGGGGGFRGGQSFNQRGGGTGGFRGKTPASNFDGGPMAKRGRGGSPARGANRGSGFGGGRGFGGGGGFGGASRARGGARGRGGGGSQQFGGGASSGGRFGRPPAMVSKYSADSAGFGSGNGGFDYDFSASGQSYSTEFTTDQPFVQQTYQSNGSNFGQYGSF